MRYVLFFIAILFLMPVTKGIAQDAVRQEENREEEDTDVFQVGYAYTYASAHEGRRTHSGELYDHDAMTAAHRTLPIGSMVRVENVGTGASVVVRVNDRGPYVEGRIIDLSGAAARRLGMPDDGYTMVRILAVEPVDVDTEAVTAIDDGRSGAANPPSTSDEYFTVQLGSYSDRTSADELAERYDEAWVQKIEVNSKTVYRVNFGVYSNRDSAEQARSKLTQAEGFVKQVDGDPPIERIREGR